ncbi:hypothetical protein Ancab_001389 [Ancistrocladus abbreviatus]
MVEPTPSPYNPQPLGLPHPRNPDLPLAPPLQLLNHGQLLLQPESGGDSGCPVIEVLIWVSAVVVVVLLQWINLTLVMVADDVALHARNLSTLSVVDSELNGESGETI